MNKVLVTLLTILFLAMEVAATFFISSTWIILFALLVMGGGVIFGYKRVALASVFSLFLYGGVFAFMEKSFYVTKDVKIVHNKIFDEKRHKIYKLDFPLIEHIKNAKGPKEIACQYYTLFGKKIADSFCYLKIGENIYALEESR